MNNILKIQQLGQSIWLDNISRDIIESGELASLIRDGISGVTSNPTIFQKAIAKGTHYDGRFQSLIAKGESDDKIYEGLTVPDIQDGADLLLPVYEATNRTDGFISFEVNPHLAYDTEATIAEAMRLWSDINRPNLMVKVPATPQGIPAIRHLIEQGLNINVTLIFSIECYKQVCDAYISGLENRHASGKSVERIASVASFFVSRVDSLVDSLLQQYIDADKIELADHADLFGQIGIANAKLAYEHFEQTFKGPRFSDLQQAGAAVQRPLWASTSTKNPNYPDTLYVDNLIGPETVNTVPPDTIEAILNRSQPAVTVNEDVENARQNFARLESAGIGMQSVTDQLTEEGVKKFADSFDELMDQIKTRKSELASHT